MVTRDFISFITKSQIKAFIKYIDGVFGWVDYKKKNKGNSPIDSRCYLMMFLAFGLVEANVLPRVHFRGFDNHKNVRLDSEVCTVITFSGTKIVKDSLSLFTSH